jgi:exodeoxyribonuclease VII small subunit
MGFARADVPPPSGAENKGTGTNKASMADQRPGAFEQKISRLEAIVKELENGNVELDRAVALFKEGKALSAECEMLLKGAQAQIDRAMDQAGSPPSEDSDEIPF